MGILVPITHPERITDLRTIGALFVALGGGPVRVEGLRATAPHDVKTLLDASREAREASFVFEGSLDPATFEALAALALADAGYVDLGACETSLRVWAKQAWIHCAALPGGDVTSAADMAGRALGVALPREPGVHEVADGEVRVTIAPASQLPLDVRTSRREGAVELFRALTREGALRGYATGLRGEAFDVFGRALRATGSTVTADVVLAPRPAVELVARLRATEVEFRGEVDVTLPEGEITTFFLAPFAPEATETWIAKVSEALAHATAGGDRRS